MEFMELVESRRSIRAYKADTKISEEMIVQINYGFSSAMSWIYFVIVIAIIGVSSLIISKGVYYYE